MTSFFHLLTLFAAHLSNVTLAEKWAQVGRSSVLFFFFFPSHQQSAIQLKHNFFRALLSCSPETRNLTPEQYEARLLNSILKVDLSEPRQCALKRENMFSSYVGTDLCKYFVMLLSTPRCQLAASCCALFFFVAVLGRTISSSYFARLLSSIFMLPRIFL